MKLIPEARVAIAHGKMEEGKLAKIMQGFIEGEYDVLVCSTIIESGLDLPNVNTMIVEESDRLGLAQLYQIRGRVGRSHRIAYAYLTYKKDKVLSEIAEKRLQAIKEFTELGSGFKIAMRDLEIRGAGNLLGSQQHGHMDSVGYDMYVRLLEESVKELKGEQKEELVQAEILLDVKANAYIDSSYISSEVVKMETYKRIASVRNEDDRIDLEDELIDRFGDIPSSVNNLITIAMIKALAEECGIASISQKDTAVLLYPSHAKSISPKVFHHIMQEFPKRLFYTATGKPYLTLKVGSDQAEDILKNIKILLQKLKNIQREEYIVYNKNE
jgi:transcription-repair coupling factor (superfamily II helicase)